MSQKAIVGFGEFLWDVFPDKTVLGGAPGNFAANAVVGGNRGVLLSAVGNDELGEKALAEIHGYGVDISLVPKIKQPTGTVAVTLDENKVPTFEIVENVAWDFVPWSDALANLAQETAAVFYGTLGQRATTSRETLAKFLAALPDDALRVLDVNLRPPFYGDEIILAALETANVLKISDEELPTIARVCELEGDATIPAEITDEVVERIGKMLNQLITKYKLRYLALTLGPQGAILSDADGNTCYQAGFETKLVSTVGAGDSFCAMFISGILAGDPLEKINLDACKRAAVVCGRPGPV